MCDFKEKSNSDKNVASPNVNTPKKPENSELDKSRLHYEDGKCFYSDPITGEKLEWNEEKHEWIRNPNHSNDYIYENGHCYYKDKSTGKMYEWDTNKNTWLPCDDENEKVKTNTNIKTVQEIVKDDSNTNDGEEEEDLDIANVKTKKVIRQDMSEGIYGTDGDNHTYTDPNDGTIYVWDKEKNAWFPKIDEDFLAKYQMNYGFVKPDADTPPADVKAEPKKEIQEIPKEEDQSLKRKAAPEPTWFDVGDQHNTKVYVSNLPTDITEQEFVDLMQKCGLVMKDVDTGRMKVKLYTEPGTNYLKGDALCTYIKVESVELALNVLDGYDFKGRKIRVERAKFTMKGNSYDPTLKPKKKRKKDKEKIKKMQEKLFDWRPDKLRGERSKHERVVIIKNLFEPSLFDQDVGLILEYQQDIREECLKCGDVRKVTIYDRHPEGVAQVVFKEPEAADACVQLLNNRWFGQRRITAEIWDGKTKFKIIESEEEKQARLKKWETFLESKSEQNANKKDDKDAKQKIEDAGEDSDNTRSSAGSQDDTDEE